MLMEKRGRNNSVSVMKKGRSPGKRKISTPRIRLNNEHYYQNLIDRHIFKTCFLTKNLRKSEKL